MSDRLTIDPARNSGSTTLHEQPDGPTPPDSNAANTGAPGAPSTTSTRRAVAAASIGTALEWYDFFLYGTAAALVFPAVFFPGSDPATAVLLSLAAYATGFVARPVGGLLAGHFGDRYGRRRVLLTTLLVMGIATALIGLLPTHAQIGAAAPALLVGLRLVQGAAAGGEWGGAALLALENTRERRGFRGGFVQSAVYAGLILGNLAFVVLVGVLSEEQLLSWGWRVPFLVSLVLVVVGVYLRRKVDESPEFTALLEQRRRSRHPLADALRAPRNVLAVFLVRTAQNTTFYIVAVFCLSYAATTLELPRWVTLTALLVASAVAMVLCPIWGALGDRIGSGRVTTLALAALGVFAVPLFLALDTASALVIIGAVTLAVGVVNSAADGVQPDWFASLFTANVRYSGITIGREAAAIVGGGLAPLAAAALVVATGHWWPVAAMMIVAAVLGFIGSRIARPVAANEESAR